MNIWGKIHGYDVLQTDMTFYETQHLHYPESLGREFGTFTGRKSFYLQSILMAIKTKKYKQKLVVFFSTKKVNCSKSCIEVLF